MNNEDVKAELERIHNMGYRIERLEVELEKLRTEVHQNRAVFKELADLKEKMQDQPLEEIVNKLAEKLDEAIDSLSHILQE